MHAPKLSNVLLIALCLTSAGQASFLKSHMANDQHGHGLVRRQASSAASPDSDTTNAATSTLTSSSAAPLTSTTSTPADNTTPTTTSTRTAATTPTTTTTTNAPAQTTAPSNSNNNDNNNSDTSTTAAANPGPSAGDPATTTNPTAATGDSATATEPIESTITQTITATNANGVLTTFTSKSVTTTTPRPGLQNSGSNDDSGSSDLTPETRNVVIGVVVGVGGAIVIGGLAYVLWRIYGRKKTTDDVDSLMPYQTGTAIHAMGMEKSDAGGSAGGGGGSASSPFQNTLERYHAPPRVNASSNF